MSHLLKNALLLLSLLLLGTRMVIAQPSIDPQAGPLPSLAVQGCFGCHGPQGRSAAPAIPSLAGQSRSYLLKVLRAYRYGGRFATVMERLLDDYSDTELREMADYFSRQSAEVPRQQVDWDLVSKGRHLHRIYCRKCHGDRNREPDYAMPRLNGQWMAYLRWTLQDYLLGANQSDDKMTQALIWVIRRHGDEGLEALLHYYGSVRPD
ncbi:MAG: cytochrome c [Chromatiales bacterium]